MTVDHIAVVSNLLFIVILIFVGGIASLFTLWLNKRMKFSYWLFSTFYFVAIVFISIYIWYFTIGLPF